MQITGTGSATSTVAAGLETAGIGIVTASLAYLIGYAMAATVESQGLAP